MGVFFPEQTMFKDLYCEQCEIPLKRGSLCWRYDDDGSLWCARCAEEKIAESQSALCDADLINHPPHYTQGGIETYDFIVAKKLNFACGNVVKYVTRAEHKGRQLEDLNKAKWYLEQEIARVEKEGSK